VLGADAAAAGVDSHDLVNLVGETAAAIAST